LHRRDCRIGHRRCRPVRELVQDDGAGPDDGIENRRRIGVVPGSNNGQRDIEAARSIRRVEEALALGKLANGESKMVPADLFRSQCGVERRLI
jgi:hypothetical protein